MKGICTQNPPILSLCHLGARSTARQGPLSSSVVLPGQEPPCAWRYLLTPSPSARGILRKLPKQSSCVPLGAIPGRVEGGPISAFSTSKSESGR